MEHVSGYCLALDLTARNLQAQAKAKGLPWTTSKGFDTFCPISDFVPREKVSDPHNLELWLKVDDVERQRGTTKDMIFQIPRLIAHVSSIMRLEEGDMICTGTPDGVGPVKPGQTVTAGITGIVSVTFQAIARAKPVQ
eukprot:TRINITY_DN1725_c0_g1_i2.p1 TRINITY_DN1725_c0_g1~~TRINITY_DN1725_c0_g1_i2.p1  ORF type:complete len:138 (-),score=6.57 TRINITY_DN1725_c0_g1_i2:262-675(-)